MSTWIFQANPSIFDVDGYLQAMPGAITWLVKQNSKEMEVGDTVFIWRSQGTDTKEKRSGVIASAEIISPVTTMLDDLQAHPYWLDASQFDTAKPRVWLRLDRVANKKEELKREWLLEDECLREMLILKRPAGTNFKLTDKEGQRLRKMWSRVGQNWSRNESVAGLWAYVETYGKEVSRSPSSPVGTVSKVTGRAVSGVYNKVMNFRSIDPRDARQGMSGAGVTDRNVWNEFFDDANQSLDEEDVKVEFLRIWGTDSIDVIETTTEDAADAATFNAEVEKLLDKSLKEIRAAYSKQQATAQSNGSDKPKTRTGRTTVFQRNPLVVAMAKLRADNRCEAPECTYELFEDRNGFRYCEVHHVVPLFEGGLDKPENTICLCPTHHKEAHLGKRSDDLRKQFHEVRAESSGVDFSLPTVNVNA